MYYIDIDLFGGKSAAVSLLVFQAVGSTREHHDKFPIESQDSRIAKKELCQQPLVNLNAVLMQEVCAGSRDVVIRKMVPSVVFAIAR
jgi:hypothetical protein